MSARHEPTNETRHVVMVAAAIGVQQDQIARMVGVSEKTLRRAYRRELAQGLVEANTQVARRLFDLATKGEPRVAVAAAISWMKTRAHWRESGDAVAVNVSQQVGAVLKVPGMMDPESWNRLAQAHHAAVLEQNATIAAPDNGTAGREREQSQPDSLEEPGACPRRRFTSEPLWYAQRRRYPIASGTTPTRGTT
jgi:hypothetical protein